MMEDKAFGSLSGSLLARKGGAKPAMRPQAFRFDQGDESAADDDCGWNDLGSDMLTDEQRATLMPSDEPVDNIATAPVREADEYDDGDEPDVARQQRELAETFSQPEPTEEEQAEQDEFLKRLASESTLDAAELEAEEVAVAAPAPVKPVAPAKPVRKRAAPGTKSVSAFTLRLDKARHLKLRLACAFAHKSAQKLMTEALDEYLERHHADLPAPN